MLHEFSNVFSTKQNRRRPSSYYHHSKKAFHQIMHKSRANIRLEVYFLRKRENLIIPLQAYDSTPSSSSKVLTLLNAKKHKAFKHTPYIIPLNCTTAPFTKRV